MLPTTLLATVAAVPSLVEQLRQIGLTQSQSAVYADLLGGTPTSLDDIPHIDGESEEDVRSAIESLIDLGLLRHENGHYSPVSPEHTLELLLRQRETELRQAREAAMSAFHAFRRREAADPSEGLIEVIQGEAIGQRVLQLQSTARDQVRILDTPPYVNPEPNELEARLLGEGVRYRYVYASEVLADPAFVEEALLPYVRLGEQARVAHEIPVKLAIVDSAVAIVGLSIKEADAGRSALVVRPCSLLTALERMFELTWDTALPLQLHEQPGLDAVGELHHPPEGLSRGGQVVVSRGCHARPPPRARRPR